MVNLARDRRRKIFDDRFSYILVEQRDTEGEEGREVKIEEGREVEMKKVE